MKFGGTSVATAENRQLAFAHIRRELEQGNQVIAVVSAMGRKGAPYATDTLLGLVDKNTAPATRDLINSCGEVISVAIFASELTLAGIPARPFTGESAGILSTDHFCSADIIDMDARNIHAALAEGVVPVITGGQGRTNSGMTTTLGRGSSDTSAVIIGGFLKADTVDIYTDVPGVAKTDPRIYPDAAFMDQVAAEDMLFLAKWGAGVIHHKAVAAGIRFGVPTLRVRSTFDTKPGTAITAESPTAEGLVGVALLKKMEPAANGEYTVGGAAYAPAEEGTLAILTAVCHGAKEEQCAALAEKLPGLVRSGDAFQAVIPMEQLQELTAFVYRTLS